MQIDHEIRGKYLLIQVNGRLDVNWAEHFGDTLLALIRQEHHHIILDASQLEFLSSAGIRSLMRIYKELISVKGSFLIIKSTSFVQKTLVTSGLKLWLADALPADFPQDTAISAPVDDASISAYMINEQASLHAQIPTAWQPWKKVEDHQIIRLSFPESIYALGVGSAAENEIKAKASQGEFVAIAGNVIYQPPDADTRPDFLLAEREYTPELMAIQALVCRGEMSHLIRFSATQEKPSYTASEIAEMTLKHTQAIAAGFVILAEIEGLVGVNLIRSPGFIAGNHDFSFPAIRDWLFFCGERMYANQQALIFGLAKRDHGTSSTLVSHMHAVVYPYQALQNGPIDLRESIQKFFNGSPPKDLMHLIDDDRPVIGLGQSAFLRGACWCAPIINPEILS